MMYKWIKGSLYQLRILEQPGEMTAIEDLQRLVWPGNETLITPGHVLLAAAENGGLVVGAYQIPYQQAEDGHSTTWEELPPGSELPAGAQLVGFVYGFPGLYFTPDGPRPKHCSHQLGVHPEQRDKGLGFALKRAQWQFVRHQELDRITWTYDPLQSRNAYLNIARLGAVCSTYIRDAYGEMRDGINIGLASDRFKVDWWVNSQRVFHRLSKSARPRLDLAHFLSAGMEIINPTQATDLGYPQPVTGEIPGWMEDNIEQGSPTPMVLIEIPAELEAMKRDVQDLAQVWRMHTRQLFEHCFNLGYMVTDFVHLRGSQPRSFYVLSYEDSTL